MSTELTVADYALMCVKADWYHEWADTMADTQKGRLEISALRIMAKQKGPEYIAVFNKFVEAAKDSQDNGIIE